MLLQQVLATHRKAYTFICRLYSAGHPLDAEVRNGLRGPEYAHPIKIGKNCWIGGSAIFIGDAPGILLCPYFLACLWQVR